MSESVESPFFHSEEEGLRIENQLVEKEAKEIMTQMEELSHELDPLYRLPFSPEKSEKVQELHERMETLRAQFNTLWDRKIAILDKLGIR